ncbi:MAG TPA: redoxin family protein [Bryobacteraceae bacterium]|nr:redoxin family protein [Bryobacteraceae bacterium]
MKSIAVWISAVALIAFAAMVSGAKGEGRMPSLEGATAWLNSAPLNSKSLRGKVVLVNFWTYSCINSLRELPYLKAWAAKYKDSGLVVVGVHTPEFGFEKDAANVKTAVFDLNVPYAVAIDSDRSIWSAFHNEYWPARYLVDGKGRIRYEHFGEGDYEKSERAIVELLRENGAPVPEGGLVRITALGAEASPSNDVRSPETYAGYERAERLASHERVARDSSKAYSLPIAPALNQWGLGGMWTVGRERSLLQTGSGRIVFRFHARDLHVVLGAARAGRAIRFKVTLDGAAPAENHGVDSSPEGFGEVRQPRLYQLIRQGERVEDRTLEVEFLDPGVELFSFTFG